MGVPQFFQWLRKKMGYVAQPVYLSIKHRLLIDAKAVMYQFAYMVPSTTQDFPADLAGILLQRFGHFAHVTFVNDGKITKAHPKYETCCKRKQTRIKQQNNLESNKRQKLESQEIKTQEQEIVEDMALERQARNAREITLEDAKRVMALLLSYQNDNIVCIQCDEGEADPVLIKMAPDFDFVISPDSDLVVGGVTNQVFGFATAEQKLYNAVEICATLEISLRQLQEIACLAGNDYMKGIRGMGLTHAYHFIRKYGTCANMLKQWTYPEHKRFQVPPNLLDDIYSCIGAPPDEYVVVVEEEEGNNEEEEEEAEEVCNSQQGKEVNDEAS